MVILTFGDIEPFLHENDDIGPITRPMLLSFFAEQQKVAILQLELATTVDQGEPFVKATYFLEGDSQLALVCYEAVQKVSEAVHIAHTECATNSTMAVWNITYKTHGASR